MSGDREKQNKKTLQTSKNGLQRCFLASLGRFELPAFRLGVWRAENLVVHHSVMQCQKSFVLLENWVIPISLRILQIFNISRYFWGVISRNISSHLWGQV